MADEPSDPDRTDERLRSALQARPEVLFAYRFGSSVRGGEHPLSDVDVAVFVEPGTWGAARRDRTAWTGGGVALWNDLHDAVADALDAPRDVAVPGAREGGEADLLVLNDAPPLLAERVARSGRVLLSRDEPARLRWIVRTKSRACDLRPLWRRLDRAVEERLREGRFGRRA